jgi:hypothetical protein
VVVIEAMCGMMTATVDTTLLSRFSVGSRNNEEMLMYHILFADNTLFFCEVNYELGNVGDVKGLARILGCRVYRLCR